METEKNEKNTVRLVAWVTPTAAEALDVLRGKLSRSAAIRHLVAGTMPRPIPTVNIEASRILAHGFGNLALLAKRLAAHGLRVDDIEAVKALLAETRAALLTAKSQLSDTEE